MGKASSAKKVSRAAKAGGKSSGSGRQLGFPIAIATVVVLGLGLVVFARNSGPGADSANPPKVGEHWHASYGIYICDHFVPNVSDRGPDTLGIHTHDDGLIHIHPFTTGAAGKQAKFARFFDQTGLQISNNTIKLPSAAPFEGRTYEAGNTTCNGKPAVVEMTYWKSALEAAEGKKPNRLITKDFASTRFTGDLGAYTIAFVPKGAKVPPPPGSGQILQDAQNDQQPQPGDGGSSPPVSGDLGSLPGDSAPASLPAEPGGADSTPGAPPATNTP